MKGTICKLFPDRTIKDKAMHLYGQILVEKFIKFSDQVEQANFEQKAPIATEEASSAFYRFRTHISQRNAMIALPADRISKYILCVRFQNYWKHLDLHIECHCDRLTFRFFCSTFFFSLFDFILLSINKKKTNLAENLIGLCEKISLTAISACLLQNLNYGFFMMEFMILNGCHRFSVIKITESKAKL